MKYTINQLIEFHDYRVYCSLRNLDQMCVNLYPGVEQTIEGRLRKGQKKKNNRRRKSQLASGCLSYSECNPYHDTQGHQFSNRHMSNMHRATRDVHGRSPYYPVDINSGAHLFHSDKAAYPFENRPSTETPEKHWFQNRSSHRTEDHHYNLHYNYEYSHEFNHDYNYEYDSRKVLQYQLPDVSPKPPYRVPLISLFSLLNVPPGSRIHCLRPGLPVPPGAVILPIIYSDELGPQFLEKKEYPSNSTPYQSLRLKTGSFPDDQTYEESSDSNILIQLPPPF